MITLSRSAMHAAALVVLLGSAAVPAFAADVSPAPVSTPAKATAQTEPVVSSKDRAEARINTLHDTLKVTAEQEEAWADVAQVMRDNETDMMKRMEEHKNASKDASAIGSLKGFQDMSQAHLDGLEKFIDAFEPFYDKLSDEQKKAADVFFSKPPEHGMKAHLKAHKSSTATKK